MKQACKYRPGAAPKSYVVRTDRVGLSDYISQGPRVGDLDEGGYKPRESKQAKKARSKKRKRDEIEPGNHDHPNDDTISQYR